MMIPAAALAVLLAGAVPEQPQFFATVDFAIVNHCRSFSEDEDRWGRIHRTPSNTTWISFWDLCWTPRLPWSGVRFPVVLTARGYVTQQQTHNIVPCDEGWIIESNDNVNVIARDVWIVASDYDWEMRNRKLFCPIRKP